MDSYYIVGICLVSLLAGFLLAKFSDKDKSTKIIELENKNQELADIVNEQNIETARLEERKAALQASHIEMENKFQILSNKIFEQKNQANKQNIEQILSPLKKQLNEFNKNVDEKFGKQSQEYFSLTKLVELSSQQTNKLTNALKGDIKVQGNWGEFILEKLLEDSGLRKGIDYIPQAQGMGLANDEGRLQKPDFIINLPEGKHVIVDSKVSMLHYEQYVNEQDKNLQQQHLNEFTTTVKNHIRDLASKRYHTIDDLNTPEFVLMFMPIEPAYILATSHDVNLQKFAWDKKIALVCPSTLFATLKTISSLWQLENQSKNVMEIARQSGALYDKFVGFLEDMQTIDASLNKASQTYQKAMNKLQTGKGNLINSAERVKKLGAKAQKQIDSKLLEDA